MIWCAVFLCVYLHTIHKDSCYIESDFLTSGRISLEHILIQLKFQHMTEMTLNILTALSEACEGTLVIDYTDIHAVTTDDDLNITIEMMDGRKLSTDDLPEDKINEAIQYWREQHPGFFQRILGSMM